MMDISNEKNIEIEINTRELLFTYLRKWWVIVLFFALGAAVAFVLTLNFVTPTYRADISIYVNNDRGLESKDYLSSADISAAQRLVNTYVTIAKSDQVLEKISEELDWEYTADELASMITAKQLNETEIFRMYVTHSDPEEAARIANVAAEVAPTIISEIIDGTSARVIDTAKVPTSRYSPSYSKYAMVGGGVGALLAIVILAILCINDTRIKDENDLMDLFDLPILGRVPDFEIAAVTNSYGYTEESETADASKKAQ